MTINTTTLLPVAAVVASILLLLAGKQRIFEIIAIIASVAWLALSLALFNWPLKGQYLSPGIVIGGLLVLSGVIVYLNTSNKREVTCSTVLTILGGMLVVNALALFG